MKWFTQKTIDIIQWVLIIGLLAMLVIQGVSYNQMKKDLVTSVEYNQENTHVRIYESQRVDKLKRENRELYDSIAKLQNVESAMVINFSQHYKTDTIDADRFQVKTDTAYIVDDDNAISQQVDTIYQYTQDNDTVNLSIDIKAKDLQWVNAEFTLHDKFMIINREKDDVNQTFIHHSPNTTIDGTTMWHRKENEKWYKKFTISPQVGVGYGIMHNKFDVYVGVGIGYKFN